MGLSSVLKKGWNMAKGYVNKNKGKWMKQAAGAAKGWYNKQGKKVLGGMLNKAAAWAKSKGVPAGLVDKAKAMAAKGADAAVNAGAKRLGAEELFQVNDLDNDPRLPITCLLVMLHEPTEHPGIQRMKDEAQQYDPELYQAAQELHLMSDEEKMALIESRAQWLSSVLKKGWNMAKGYVNKNKGKWMKQAAGGAKGLYNKQGKKVLKGMLDKAGKWAKSKGVPAGLVDKAKAMAAKGADAAVNAGAKRLGAEELPLVGGNWNHEDVWDENRAEWGNGLSAMKSAAGSLGNTVSSMSSKLQAGLKAVSDTAACAKDPKKCAKDHCPAVVTASAKAVAAGGKASAVTQAAALCGSLGGQLALVLAPVPPAAAVVGVAVTAGCTAYVRGQIDKGVNMLAGSFATGTCNAIFGKEL